jgi:glycosyltransferase involved in cell wall biosynthesis
MHNVNGLMVPARHAGALADAIRYLYQHPEERERMGRAARDKVVSDFDQGIIFEHTLSVYRDLMTSL